VRVLGLIVAIGGAYFSGLKSEVIGKSVAVLVVEEGVSCEQFEKKRRAIGSVVRRIYEFFIEYCFEMGGITEAKFVNISESASFLVTFLLIKKNLVIKKDVIRVFKTL
jgi:hypothetical protein